MPALGRVRTKLEPLRGRASSWVGLAVSAVSLAAVIWWISRQDAPSLPKSPGGVAWLALALAIVACNFGLRGLRWHLVLRGARIRHRARDAFGLTLVGYMGNCVLPARGGELLKIGLLSPRSDARRRALLGTVIVERVLDCAVLGALLVGLTWAGVKTAPDAGTAAALAAGALVLAALALAAYVRLRRRGRFERFAAAARPVAGAGHVLVERRGLAPAALTVLIWWIDGATLGLLARTGGLELGLPPALGAIVLASLAAAIPAAPGYVGTFDAAMLVALHAGGVAGSKAVTILLLARFAFFVPVTLAGLATLVVGYGGLRGLRAYRRAEPLARTSA